MKKVVYILICAMGLLFAACSLQTKNEKNDVQVLINDSTNVDAPQRMQASEVQSTITFKGKEYQSTVVRRADEKLSMVKNEQGEKFIDNSITLRIVCGGKQLVDRVFSKNDFASLIDDSFMKRGILEGMVYHQTTPQGIEFAASICYPQTELYVPLKLTVTATGEISIAKAELMEDLFETDSIS